MKRVLTILCTITVCLQIAGCSHSEGNETPTTPTSASQTPAPSPTQSESGDPNASATSDPIKEGVESQTITDTAISTYAGSYQGVGDGALLEGTLKVLDGCLIVINKDGGLTIPIFPSDDTRTENGKLISGDKIFSVGQKVSLGGGFLHMDDAVSSSCQSLAKSSNASNFTVHFN
ncbi:hypothetical protein [Trueperella sp. LYQ143]|uniref:hypothetical protein n=1 Tax=unclassified Trueperella TaxID=2630174 RepID=UPI0039838D2A